MLLSRSMYSFLGEIPFAALRKHTHWRIAGGAVLTALAKAFPNEMTGFFSRGFVPGIHWVCHKAVTNTEQETMACFRATEHESRAPHERGMHDTLPTRTVVFVSMHYVLHYWLL